MNVMFAIRIKFVQYFSARTLRNFPAVFIVSWAFMSVFIPSNVKGYSF